MKITEIEDDKFGFWFELQNIHVAKAAHATVNTSAVPFDVSRVLEQTSSKDTPLLKSIFCKFVRSFNNFMYVNLF